MVHSKWINLQSDFFMDITKKDFNEHLITSLCLDHRFGPSLAHKQWPLLC